MGSTYVSFGIKNPTLYRLMFSVAPTGPDWRPEKVLAGWIAARAVLENIVRRGARVGIFDPTLARKSELQTAALYTWAVVHGLTMLAIDGLANVERLSVEREYIENLTLLRDVRILLMTLPAVFGRRGAF